MDIDYLGLRIVPIDTVVPHEIEDPRRVERLSSHLRKEGWLRNPPLVVKKDATHVILDGTTRTHAMRILGYQHILVQVVEPGRVRVDTWNHLVQRMSDADFWAELNKLPLLTFRQLVGSSMGESPNRWAGRLYFANGEAYSIELPRDCTPAGEVEALNRLVSIYTGEREIRRCLESDIDTLKKEYKDLTALVSFPHYTAHDILEFGLQGQRVPPGITRCIVPGRVLRVNVDLTLLESSVLTLEQKNARLREYIHARLVRQPLRYYEESIYIFED